MTPEISTRLAASPRPESTSSAGSRSAPPENSPGPSMFFPVPLDGPPSFLDSKPSDPMTPDLTHHLRPRHLKRRRRLTRPSMTFHDDTTRISRIKDNTPACGA